MGCSAVKPAAPLRHPQSTAPSSPRRAGPLRSPVSDPRALRHRSLSPAAEGSSLQVYVQLPTGGCIPVDVPTDATVGDLRAAIEMAGGPKFLYLKVAYQGVELEDDDVELSQTQLSMESLVHVTQRPPHRSTVSAGPRHGLALLDSGEVIGWGSWLHWHPIPEFGARVTSVHAGGEYSMVLLEDGQIVAWGLGTCELEEDLRRLESRQAVSCSPSASGSAVTVVDADGVVSVCGTDAAHFGAVPFKMQGKTVAVSTGKTFMLGLTVKGEVYSTGRCRPPDIGGVPAVSVSAGLRQSCAAFEDGSVVVFGSSRRSVSQPDMQPAVPPSPISCACMGGSIIVLSSAGVVHHWGREFADIAERMEEAGRIAAISAGPTFAAAVTTEGSLAVYPAAEYATTELAAGRKVAVPLPR